MGVPNQASLQSLSAEQQSSSVRSGSDAREVKYTEGATLSSDSWGDKIPLDPFFFSDVNLPNPATLGAATFAASETAQLDCGSTIQMWFMCRLFSPRRRQRRRSSSDGRSQQLQQQQGEEAEEDSEDGVLTAPGKVGCDHPPPVDACSGSAGQGGPSETETGLDLTMEGEQEVKTAKQNDLHLIPDSDKAGGSRDNNTNSTVEDDDYSDVVDVDISDLCMADQDGGDHGHNGNCQDQYDPGGNTSGNQDEDRDEELKNQLAMVQAMVQEMKVGFMAALDQLSSMQDGDQTAFQKMDATVKRQDQQLSDFTQTMESLRNEVTVLSSNVRQVISTQQSLQDRLVAMQTAQQQLLGELVSTGVLSEQSRETLSKYCQQEHRSQSFSHVSNLIHASQNIENKTEAMLTESKTDVTTAACKSLSLTQALAARCQDIDVSDSSEEDVTSSRPQKHGNDFHGQSITGQSLSHSAVADPPQRRQAVQEIVESEQEYCTQLWTVVNVYHTPLQNGHYMSSRQLCILFPSSLAELYDQHSQMLHSLQDRLVHWSYAGVVGDVFARMMDSNNNLLGLYQEYVESLPGSISCLRRQMAQSRSFRIFIKGQKEGSSNGDLLSLLISPLQRIPKYMLQLQQVLQHTREDHPDHFNLQASLGQLQDFVERFNHDITHTTQAIALDLQHLQGQQSASFRSSASGSSCEVLPPTTSTIDSGIQSTGEDTFPPRFVRNGCADYDGYQWAEKKAGYHQTDPRNLMAMQRRGYQQQSHLKASGQHSRYTSHSQPDLTHGGYIMPNTADPQASVPQIRSHSKIAATAADRSARQRRYKIKKTMEGQGPYGAQSSLRPASAMDFAEPQDREDRDQVVMRPHSVLGPFPGDGRNRVIQVYSRKPPRAGHRMSDSGLSASVPAKHVMRSSPQPHIQLNGHWDPAAGGDPSGHCGPLIDYDDEEDDTRALSDTHSGSSHKPSSHNSQDAHESETENSDDYSQEDLAAALSHHLNNGNGMNNHHTVSAHDLLVKQQQYKEFQHSVYNGVIQQDEDKDENLDVQLDSPESDYMHSLRQLQKPPEHMSEELKLDLTCFQDENEMKPTLLKRSQPAEPCVDVHGPLSMKPLAGNTNNSADVEPKPFDRSQTEPPKEVVESLSGEKDKGTSLPPIRLQDAFPTVADTNSRTMQPELDRPPVRRSVTPSEFSTVNRPSMLRRAATPSSEYLAASDTVSSKAGRRKKDSKTTSSENLHRSIDDVSLSASKKKPFRTSLKNLFHRKKGSVILDELEREYTKELVRQCLVKNGHASHMDNHANNNTTPILNNNVYNHSEQVCMGEMKCSDEEENQNNKNSNFSVHSSNLWSKMRKSPLFSLSKSSDASSEACFV